ncbi:L-fucose:H+ symporter permease [Cladochytrium replicatum]|nr:L-fucose:H+ symporter permease [Cladochytrium replicatum]
MGGISAPITTSQNAAAAQKTLWGPLILVTSLFFLWGLAYGLLDVLNKHLQEVLGISRTQSTLLQLAYCGAYFVMGIYPAGAILRRFGYRIGIIFGLGLYILGAILMYPASSYLTYPGLLVAIFVVACGLSTLESAANPYIAILGPTSSSAFRLNLSQSFNGIGSVIGPVIASYAFFGGSDYNGSGVKTGAGDLTSVKYVYLGVAGIVFLIMIAFIFVKLPEINEAEKVAYEGGLEADGGELRKTKIWEHTNLIWGVFAQFGYIGAQFGIASLFINVVTESISISSSQASLYLTYSLVMFTIARFIGSALLKYISARILLAIYSLCGAALCAYLIAGTGVGAVVAVMATYFFMSIMFPTIFTLAMENLGEHTKQGASFMVSSLLGGSIWPLCMAAVGDATGVTARGFFMPMIGFLMVLFFAVYGSRVPEKVKVGHHGPEHEAIAKA